MVGPPGASEELRAHGKGRIARWLWVVVPEVVDELFDADRLRRGQRARREKAPDVGIRGRVDGHREGRERLLLRGDEWIVANPVVGLGVEATEFGGRIRGRRRWSRGHH